MDNQAYLTELTRELLDLELEKKQYDKEMRGRIKGVKKRITEEVGK